MKAPQAFLRCRRCRSGKGFSLVELLFAIFIVGTAMAMAGALFPAAVRQNESSFADTSGAIICNNALALAEMFLDADDVDATDPNFQVLADEGTPGKIGLRSQQYPIRDSNDPNSRRGFVLLGRWLPAEGPVVQHQLVAVAYAKRGDGQGEKVTAELLAAKIREHDARASKIVADPIQIDKPPFGINSPVVLPDGRIAKIIAVREDGGDYHGILDRRLKDLEDEDRDVYVVRERNEFHFSPALKAVLATTWLKKP